MKSDNFRNSSNRANICFTFLGNYSCPPYFGSSCPLNIHAPQKRIMLSTSATSLTGGLRPRTKIVRSHHRLDSLHLRLGCFKPRKVPHASLPMLAYPPTQSILQVNCSDREISTSSHRNKTRQYLNSNPLSGLGDQSLSLQHQPNCII
jgi:hypothetical protein